MKIIGCLMIAAGIAIGLYVGVWLMFIGGIVQVIEQIRATDMSSAAIAIGIARVIFAGIVGYVSASALVIPGIFLAMDE